MCRVALALPLPWCTRFEGSTMNSTSAVVGAIVSVWRYPVKSMMGEDLNAAEVSERGLLGDRAYAIVDSSDGKVASAKNPRKWPRLFDFRAALASAPRMGAKLPPAHITLPDGALVDTDQPDLHRILSQALNREVTLGAIAPSARKSKIAGEKAALQGKTARLLQ